MEDASSFNKGPLHGAYNGSQDKTEFPAYEFRDTLVDNIAARDWTIVTCGVWVGNLWNEGDSYCVLGFQDGAICKEVLNCFHNICAKNLPRNLVEPAIEAIQT